MSRARWHPPANRICQGSKRCWNRRPWRRVRARARRSGACAPGFSTRRTSASARSTSGIVHSVMVESAASKRSSGKSSRAPSSAPRAPERRRRDPRLRELQRDRRRLHDPDAGHLRRVVRHVEPGAEPELDHVTVQSRARAGPDLLAERLAPEHHVGEPRQNLIAVDTHACDRPGSGGAGACSVIPRIATTLSAMSHRTIAHRRRAHPEQVGAPGAATARFALPSRAGAAHPDPQRLRPRRRPTPTAAHRWITRSVTSMPPSRGAHQPVAMRDPLRHRRSNCHARLRSDIRRANAQCSGQDRRGPAPQTRGQRQRQARSRA